MSLLITADYEVDLGGLLVSPASEPFGLRRLAGWLGMPGVRSSDEPRARKHGAHAGLDLADPRVLDVELDVLTSDVASLQELRDRFVPGRFLTVWARTPGEPVQSVYCRVRRAPVEVDVPFSQGITTVRLQLVATDPRRYSTSVSATTGLPVADGGKDYGASGLAYPIDYGAAGGSGRVTLVNEGNADAPVELEVFGPLLDGFEVTAVETGQRIRYVGALTAGQRLVLDTGAGTVLLEGTASRRQLVTVAEWFTVPARGSLTVAFSSLGGYDPAAAMTARFRSAWWS